MLELKKNLYSLTQSTRYNPNLDNPNVLNKTVRENRFAPMNRTSEYYSGSEFRHHVLHYNRTG